MGDNRRRLTTLGLASMAVLTLVATIAPNALANPLWRVDLTLLHGTEEFEGEGGSLEFLVQELGLALACGEVSAIGEIEKLHHGKARLKFESCEVLGAPVCEVPDFEFSFLLLLILHKNKKYMLFHPLNSPNIGTVTILGEECSVSTNEEPVSGSVVAAMSEEEATNQEITFLGELEVTKLFPGHLWLMSADPVVADGTSVALRLRGPNLGRKWGAQ